VTALLLDPTYEPKHPPVEGRIPHVVEKWGPRSQLRYFQRFWAEIKWGSYEEQWRYYLHSTQHRGPCCESCLQDKEMGYDIGTGDCCCRAIQERE
jgi:hypothetical protein